MRCCTAAHSLVQKATAWTQMRSASEPCVFAGHLVHPSSAPIRGAHRPCVPVIDVFKFLFKVTEHLVYVARVEGTSCCTLLCFVPAGPAACLSASSCRHDGFPAIRRYEARNNRVRLLRRAR